MGPKMKTDNVGSFHRFIKVAIDGLFDHRAYFFNTITLSVDTITQSHRVVAAIHFVFPHFKDDLAHGNKLRDYRSGGKLAAGRTWDMDFLELPDLDLGIDGRSGCLSLQPHP